MTFDSHEVALLLQAVEYYMVAITDEIDNLSELQYSMGIDSDMRNRLDRARQLRTRMKERE